MSDEPHFAQLRTLLLAALESCKSIADNPIYEGEREAIRPVREAIEVLLRELW